MATFREQYPLSPRKFWKKYLGKFLSWLFLWIFVTIVGMFVSLSFSGSVSGIAAIVNDLIVAETILIIGGLVLYGWYIRTYIARYYYDANDAFVTIKKGVFAPTEIHVQYTKIQDVYVDQDILDRIMGLYDVHIASATATSGIEAHIDGVEQTAAEGLKELLLAKIQGSSNAPGMNAAASGGSPLVGGTISPVVMSEDISTTSYPLAPAWVVQQLVTYFFSSLFFSAVITFYLAMPGKNSSVSLLDAFGISPIAMFAAVFVIAYVFHVIYIFIWKNNFSFNFLPEYIVMKTGVIARSEVHVPYHTIQDVIVSQGIIERLFGLATAKIQNAAAAQVVSRKVVNQNGINIPGQTLVRANHISDVVKSILGTRNTSQTGL
jgi:putative membrane protein